MISPSLISRIQVLLLGTILLLCLVQPTFGQGLVERILVPPVGLEMLVEPKGAMMEAKFTNNTKKDLGVVVGGQAIRLKPGASGSHLFNKQESLMVAEFEPQADKHDHKVLFETMIQPQANRTNLKIAR